MSTSTRQPARPRRIDDALSQLIDSLTPPLPITAIQDDDFSDPDEALASAEERRHNAQLDRAWRILDTHPTPSNTADAASPGGRRGTISDNVNNAADLIKRKLRHENASPELAVKFSNMYSKLLTQPVLSQKWGILYLLYKLSGESELDPATRSRSPLMDDGNLQSMLARERSTARPSGPRAMDSEDDEGPAVSSSASQRVPQASRAERQSSLREEWEAELASYEREKERVRDENAYRASFNEASAERGREGEERARAGSRRPSTRPGYHEDAAESIEQRLLRDLPFNLQGLSSKNLQFESETVLNLPDNLPVPMVSLLNSLAEPCLLYKELAIFVEGSEGGLVNQSLRAAIATELRSYLGLVATLEAEIRQALAAIGNGSDIKGMRKGGVTLKRCMVWTRDATMALRLMSIIVEESRGKSGLCLSSSRMLMFCRQERRPVDFSYPWIFLIAWRPVCGCIC